MYFQTNKTAYKTNASIRRINGIIAKSIVVLKFPDTTRVGSVVGEDIVVIVADCED